MGEVRVWKESGQWRFEGDAGYETRRASVERLISLCDQSDPLPDFPEGQAIIVQLGDQPSKPSEGEKRTHLGDQPPKISEEKRTQLGNQKTTHVAFSTDGLCGVTAAPDFVFDHWRQVGIHDYEEVCANVEKKGKEATDPEGKGKVGWVGNADTNFRRGSLLNLARRFPQYIHAVDTGPWKENKEKDGILATSRAAFIGLGDLVSRYDFLLDIEGNGYSGRLKILLHSGKPVLIQDRPWREFYFDGIKPFVHYVPVRRDLSDLVWRVHWLRQNPTEAKIIGKNASEFAKKHLTRLAAAQTWRQIILKHITAVGS